MVFKKDIRAGKGTTVTKHAGKGSQMAPMPNRNTLSQLTKPGNQSINDYAKAAPQPTPAPGVPGLGDGDWSGNGM